MKTCHPLVAVAFFVGCASGGEHAPDLDARDAAAHDAAAEPVEGLADDWQARAAGYLELRSASWLESPPDIANVKCAMSCHTTFSYLMARATLAPLVGDGLVTVDDRELRVLPAGRPFLRNIATFFDAYFQEAPPTGPIYSRAV